MTSARAGPAGIVPRIASSREQARAGSDDANLCSAARTTRRCRASILASGVTATASSARSPAASHAPRRAAARAASSAACAAASSGACVPRARWRARASVLRTTAASRWWAARRSAGLASPAITDRITGWAKVTAPSLIVTVPDRIPSSRSDCATAGLLEAAQITGSDVSAASAQTSRTSRAPAGRAAMRVDTSRRSDSGASCEPNRSRGMPEQSRFASSRANSGLPPEVSCSRTRDDRPGAAPRRVPRISRIAPRLSGPTCTRSSMSRGMPSTASGTRSLDQPVRAAASSPSWLAVHPAQDK